MVSADLAGFRNRLGHRQGCAGKGYASEAARAAIDWAFANFEIAHVIHCIDRENVASQGVAQRLGAEKRREIELFGHVADIWVTTRQRWTAPRN
jgi:RimJ/RimL family protein N-acetyltransferase